MREKNVQTTPTRTHRKCSRPLLYCYPNCRTPRHWKLIKGFKVRSPNGPYPWAWYCSSGYFATIYVRAPRDGSSLKLQIFIQRPWITDTSLVIFSNSGLTKNLLIPVPATSWVKIKPCRQKLWSSQSVLHGNRAELFSFSCFLLVDWSQHGTDKGASLELAPSWNS